LTILRVLKAVGVYYGLIEQDNVGFGTVPRGGVDVEEVWREVEVEKVEERHQGGKSK
jgi:hypothetical protein